MVELIFLGSNLREVDDHLDSITNLDSFEYLYRNGSK